MQNNEPIVIDRGPAGFIAQLGNDIVVSDTRVKLMETIGRIQERNREQGR
jgi:hypothetical protein